MDIKEHKEKILKIGQVGEKIVRNYLNKLKNVSIEDSTNLYDSKKDFVMEVLVDENDLDDESSSFRTFFRKENGELTEFRTGEIKTCTPYFTEQELSIREKQLDKCRSVDDLYFVTVPSIKYKSEYAGWILRVEPKTFRTRPYSKPDPKEKGGIRYMRGIKFEQPSVTKLRQLYKSELRDLLQFSVENLNKQQIEYLVNLYGIDDPVRRLVT
jgi:hypothetical protein